MAPEGEDLFRDRLPAAPGRLSASAWTLLSLALAAVLAAWHLELDPRRLIPGEGGRRVAMEFFSRALSPALTSEAPGLDGAALRPLWLQALQAAHTTVIFAAAAMSLALVGGVLLGFMGCTAWWSLGSEGDAEPGRGPVPRSRWWWAPWLYGATRAFIALLRSIHELLWAVLFLAAFGLGHLTAVLAIALPYAGTLAKVFSEMVDEVPRETAHALRHAGASPLQVFCFALAPRALPDLAAYAFYRFECALRSSAILGFFGFPTLGYYLAASFENLYYGEVWTYLYTLFALVLLADVWSGFLRRRVVGP